MEATVRELVPRKVRLVVYLVVSLVALVIGVWQQAEGNTLLFVVNLAAALQGVLASANLNPPEQLPITLEDASIDYIVDVFEERGITIQDLANAGLHVNPRLDPTLNAPPSGQATPHSWT